MVVNVQSISISANALHIEVIQSQHMRLIRVPTKKQLADILTKALQFLFRTLSNWTHGWKSEDEGTLSLWRGKRTVQQNSWELR
jgi:hypothetical protein